jgi:FkbM family methyltransferase
MAALPLRLKVMRLVGKQTWIPRGQDWLLRQIWDPGRNFPFVVDFFGMQYPGNLNQLVDWRVFAYGCHASSELTVLDALCKEIRKKKKQVTCYDVGANLGHHTLFMAGIADEVVAFEPFPALQEKIRQKMALNGFAHVKVVPFGLGDTDQVLKYYPGGGGNSGSGTFIPEENGTYTDPIDLCVRNGDRLFAELDLPPIDLMKVDVEGFEPYVFRGLADRIQRDRPPILTEMSDRSRDFFGSEAGFRKAFWDGAVFAEVTGRSGCPYQLHPFRYETSGEILILPPEMAYFVEGKLRN